MPIFFFFLSSSIFPIINHHIAQSMSNYATIYHFLHSVESRLDISALSLVCLCACAVLRPIAVCHFYNCFWSFLGHFGPSIRIDRHDYYCQSAWHTFITRAKSPPWSASVLLSSFDVFIYLSRCRARNPSLGWYTIMPSFTSITKHIGLRLHRSSCFRM